MQNVKRTKNRKKYFKLRKRNLWFPIALTVVVSLLSALFLELFISSQYSYVTDMRIRSEYEFVDLAAASYMENSSADADPFGILEKSGRSYVLMDENGKVKEQFGSNTLGDMSYKYEDYYTVSAIEASEIEDVRLFKVWIYNDTENNILVTDHGETDLDIRKIGKEVRKGLYAIFREEDSDSDADLINQELKLPLWMRYDLDNGEQLFVKIAIAINFSDIIYLFLLLFLENLLLVLVIIVMIIYTVSSFLSHRKMTRVFFTDLATKGHNRIWFLLKGDQVLQKRRSAKKSFAVVDLSLVNYRIFCACHSIEEGEDLICRIYDAIKAKISKKELCAHFNDGNYALLLMYEDEGELRNRIGELLKTLENVDTEHTFPFHIGVTFIPPAESGGMFVRRKNVDIETDYNHASAAKASIDDTAGSAIAYFDDKLIEDQRWSETVTEMQQRALDNEEFIVYYQPKYDPRSNELRGAEALIRWQSPEHGFITPYRFIPIFEKNGFITEIDHYMLEHVARDQRRWLDQGYKCVPVSVNVSRAHFIESDLAEQIRDIVDKEGTPHRYIEIELTESAFFDDKNAMIRTISKLKEYGFAVSMDDFGSGYSSLNSLKDMPLDVLKLDAEFFRGETAGTDRGEIVVSEAIKLAKSLNMRTVAEGVEIKEQVDFLADQGCDMIQGYYFAKPMPGTEFESKMKDGIANTDE